MNKASITQAKNTFSSLLDKVRHGQTIIIMDRQCPVARLAPIVEGGARHESSGHIKRLERAGLMVPARCPVLPKWLVNDPPPKSIAGASALQALLEERETGR
jgi:prevent-host-death family protein